MSVVVSVGSAEVAADGFGTSFSTTFKRKSGCEVRIPHRHGDALVSERVLSGP